MGKRLIRLTESDLHWIVKEAVNKILREDGEGSVAMGDGSGMVEPPSSPEDVGASSSLRNKTYDAPANKKNNFYADADDHKDMIRKSFEGEGRVGHKG